MFCSMHVGEKCRALRVARFRAVQCMSVVTASTAWVPFWQMQGYRKKWNDSPSVLEDKVHISSVSNQLGGQLMTRWRASVPGARSTQIGTALTLGMLTFTEE